MNTDHQFRHFSYQIFIMNKYLIINLVILNYFRSYLRFYSLYMNSAVLIPSVINGFDFNLGSCSEMKRSIPYKCERMYGAPERSFTKSPNQDSFPLTCVPHWSGRISPAIHSVMHSSHFDESNKVFYSSVFITEPLWARNYISSRFFPALRTSVR